MSLEENLGWKAMLDGYPRHFPPGGYPIPAYSEFMPPPRLGLDLEGNPDPLLFYPDDPYGWPIAELEEEQELRPGLEHIAGQILSALAGLGKGEPAHLISGRKGANLADNPYWPPELAAQAGRLAHERYLTLLPLALSRTQDDKGRLRWTFFGGSEQGPERAFWKSFYTAPGREIPASESLAFIRRILGQAYGERCEDSTDLLRLGFRILAGEPNPRFPAWRVDPLPDWCGPFLLCGEKLPPEVRYLLSFRPFGRLPAPVRERYLGGTLHLLPFPGSLVFWGMPTYLRLQQDLPWALQIPLLHLVKRNRGHNGLKVPQSGWIHEPRWEGEPSDIHAELLSDTFIRTSRMDRISRDQDELALALREAKVAKVLFSTELEAMGLYDKPLARNSQIWSRHFELLLDGPRAGHRDLLALALILRRGGLFGYRFQLPALRVGSHELYWQRPLVAWLDHASGEPVVLADGPTGYLTAYPAQAPDLERPLELWPRILRRPTYLSALKGLREDAEHPVKHTSLNIIKLLETFRLRDGRPLPRGFARRLLWLPRPMSLEEWLSALPRLLKDPAEGERIKAELEGLLEPPEPPRAPQAPPASLTYAETATRAFEEAFWQDIAFLSHGPYVNKDNADCVLDPATQARLAHPGRDLEALGEYLLGRHRAAITAAGLEGRAVCGELPFYWETDFNFTKFEGWMRNQEKLTQERDLLVVIPGRNRKEAVVLGDHYDTAYMGDVLDSCGARLAAPGADDNHSATATLLQAAPVFLKLARQGLLERDVWLLHLTGEEFPSDCLGARHFCRALKEKSLKLVLAGGQTLDLSQVRITGVVVMDMIAHNRDEGRYVFQISPGRTPGAMELALQAYLANQVWNESAPHWNRGPERRGRGAGKRSDDPARIPEVALYPHLHSEVRPQYDPHSSLYNTDVQIFSDIGAPAVLFMENYDISREGYHDTADTVANIDLDYGAAVAAIAIETIARAAMETRELKTT